MQLLTQGILRAGSLIWQSRSGAYALTVVCKATYQLTPGLSLLLPHQETLHDGDLYLGNNPARGLWATNDLVPYKPRADVLLVGDAYSPGGAPTRSLRVRLAVGSNVDKSIEVYCDRRLAVDGRVFEGHPLSRFPLGWDRAAAGSTNPIGMHHNLPADPYGTIPVPNLQSVGSPPISATDWPSPIGYGPLAAKWPGRKEKLGGSDPPTSWHDARIPDNLDYAFFNVAPIDQQTYSLPPDAQIVLENLHPTHPRLTTKLSGVVPQVVVERSTSKPNRLGMVLDTLWIDTDRGICTVTWRGRISLANADEATIVRVWTPDIDSQPTSTAEKLVPDVQAIDIGTTMPPGFGASVQPALPFQSADTDPSSPSGPPGSQPARYSALPFNPAFATEVFQPAPPSAPTQPAAHPPAAAGSTAFTTEIFQTKLPSPSGPQPKPAQPVASRTPTAFTTEVFQSKPLTKPSEPQRSPAQRAAMQETIVPERVTVGDAMPFRGVVDASAQPPHGQTEQPRIDAPRSDPKVAVQRDPLLTTGTLDGMKVPAKEALPFKSSQPRQTSPASTSPSAVPSESSEIAMATPQPVAQDSAIAAEAHVQPSPEPLQQPPMLGPLAVISFPTHDESQTSPDTLTSGSDPENRRSAATQPEQPSPVVDLPIETCATIRADLDAKPADMAKTLDEHKLTESDWEANEQRWVEVIEQETSNGETTLLASFDAAYVARLEARHGPIQPSDYAQILGKAKRGGTSVLGIDLPPSAIMRIRRVGMQKMARDQDFAAELRKAMTKGG